MGDDPVDFLLAALGLYLAIEGSAFALFPEQVKRVFEMVPAPALRAVGLVAAASGVLLVWLVRR